MAIKLYGSTLSTCTQRVLQVLTELDVPYEYSDVNMALGEHKVIQENPYHLPPNNPETHEGILTQFHGALPVLLAPSRTPTSLPTFNPLAKSPP